MRESLVSLGWACLLLIAVSAPRVGATVLTAVQVEELSAHSASISWTTDAPSDSCVEYRKLGNTIWLASGLADGDEKSPGVTAHLVELKGLESGQTYEYRARSRVVHWEAVQGRWGPVHNRIVDSVVTDSQIRSFTLPSSANRHWQPSDMSFEGAMRMPSGEFGNSSRGFQYGLHSMAYNRFTDTLYVAGHDWDQMVAEVTIELGKNFDDLPVARVIQGFEDITDGEIGVGTRNGAKLGGMHVVGPDRIVGAVYEYYDADSDHRKTLYSAPTDLRGKAQGLFEVGSLLSGFVGLYMGDVPAPWRSRMGRDLALGGAGVPIAKRTSQGPALYAIDTSSLGSSKIEPKPLVSYPLDRPHLYDLDARNPFFTWQGSRVRGVVWLEGTSVYRPTVVFFGIHGAGDVCYGPGTDDPDLHGTPAPGGTWCYHPGSTSKGGHAFPYVPYYWAYDPEDLEAVSRGKTKPWQVRPVSMGDLSQVLPDGGGSVVRSAAYDRERSRLFLAFNTDGKRPLVVGFRMARDAATETVPNKGTQPAH